MKKLVTLALVMVLVLSSFGMVAEARVGDVIGKALHTDIVAYVNHFVIPSYIVNGTSVVVAEELVNFGFNVDWDPYARTLNIYRNGKYEVECLYYVDKSYATGEKCADILATDIRVYANGQQITSYNINGKTMIPMEELTMFGDVVWDQYGRTLKMWVANLEEWPSPQPVSKKYYSGTTAPDFGWVTKSPVWGTEGDFWIYLADGTDVETYKNYITSVGYRYNTNVQLNDGAWALGYANPNTHIGLGFWETADELGNHLVYVFYEPGVDVWK